MKRSIAIKIEGQLSEISPQHSFSAKLECNRAVLMETLPHCCTSSKLAWGTYSGSHCSQCCCCCCCSDTAGHMSRCSASVPVSDEKEPHQSGKSTPAASRCRLSHTVPSAALAWLCVCSCAGGRKWSPSTAICRRCGVAKSALQPGVTGETNNHWLSQPRGRCS